MNTKRACQSLTKTSSVVEKSLGNVMYTFLKENIHRNLGSINYRDLLESSVKLNQWIRIQSIQENDVILIIWEKPEQYFIPTLAAFYSSIIVVYLESNSTLSQIKHALEEVKPKMIFCAKSKLASFKELKKQRVRLPKIAEFEKIPIFVNDIKVDILNFIPKQNTKFPKIAAVILLYAESDFTVGVLSQRDYISWITNSKYSDFVIPTMEYLKTVMGKQNLKILQEELNLKCNL